MSKKRKAAFAEREIYPLPRIARARQVEERVARKLDELAASAVECFRRGRGRKYERTRDEYFSSGNGGMIRSHAHGWCFELHGQWAHLAAADCVYHGWMPVEHWECIGVNLRGRKIEIFRLGPSVEVQIEYTSEERRRIYEESRRGP